MMAVVRPSIMNQSFGTQIFIKTLGATKAVRAEPTDALGDVLRLAQVRWVCLSPAAMVATVMAVAPLCEAPLSEASNTGLQEDVGALPAAVRATHYGRLLESGCTLGQCGIGEGDFINMELRLR
jgi:hypothetical protein